MKLHYFQHVPFEGLGLIKTWAQDHAFQITSTRFFKGETPPDPHEYDWLVVMGGPMNIYQYDLYPWLAAEKQAIRAAVEQNKTIIGVCLGGQLIADVLGAKTTRNPEKEIGWYPITKHPDADGSAIAGFLPQQTMALHWHGDTFAIPEKAVPLASSTACANQGFIYDDRVVGLQFHLETTLEGIQLMADNMREELVKAPWVQDYDEIVSDTHIQSSNQVMLKLLNTLNG